MVSKQLFMLSICCSILLMGSSLVSATSLQRDSLEGLARLVNAKGNDASKRIPPILLYYFGLPWDSDAYKSRAKEVLETNDRLIFVVPDATENYFDIIMAETDGDISFWMYTNTNTNKLIGMYELILHDDKDPDLVKVSMAEAEPIFERNREFWKEWELAQSKSN